MRMFKVGRSSVREALRVLITLGLVEAKPSRGTIVAARAADPIAFVRRVRERSASVLHKWALLDLLEVRESLEGQAAFLAAERATPQDLDDVASRLQIVETQIQNRRTYFRANSEFHIAIARASHNNVLLESIRRLVGQVRLYREHLMRRVLEMSRIDVAEHRAIFDAMRAGDRSRARAAMIGHIRGFADIIRKLNEPLDREQIILGQHDGRARKTR